MVKKRPWQEPLLKSLDELPSVYGECKVGSTPVAGSGSLQCNSGNGASRGICTAGNGAQSSCLAGTAVR